MLNLNPTDTVKLHVAAKDMADVLYAIRMKMAGRGINPVEAPIVALRIEEIEQKLRMMGANPQDPFPFLR